MKNLSLSLLRYLCSFMICAAPFAASAQEIQNEEQEQPIEKIEPVEKDDDKYVTAGERPLSDEELEEAFTIAEEEPSKEEIKEDTAAVKRALAAISTDTGDHLRTAAGVCSGMQTLKRAATFFVTTHPGAFHWPLAISPYGDRVELGDGSVWAIRSTDAYAVLNWYSTDIIVITPNHEWFSIYSYRLNNQNTGVSVAANLSLFLSPVFHTIYNHRIVSFDDYARALWLEDGSVWSVYPDDYSMKWAIGDTIIIGINDGWFSSTRPNILINANVLGRARATCLN